MASETTNEPEKTEKKTKSLADKLHFPVLSNEKLDAEYVHLIAITGLALNNMRKVAGLKIKELSASTGIRRDKLADILKGRRKISLKDIAKISLACNKHLMLELINEKIKT